MKRWLLLLVLMAAVPAFAFTPTAVSIASQNSGTTRAVMEPVISVQDIGGVTHGAVAWVNFPDASGAPFSAQIQAAHTTDFVNWSAPVTLPLTATNGVTYQNSADPVFVLGNYWPYIGTLFCFGTMWTNTNYRGQSTIGAWRSTDGGLTWSAPDAIDAPPYDPACEAAGTCIFDDKPAASLETSSGVIYVAFTRTTSSSTSIYLSALLGTRGWASIGLIAANTAPLPGPTPVVDPTNNAVWMFTMNRNDNTIHTFYNGGDGWLWSEIAEVYSAPGINVQGVTVGTTSVRAVPFFTARFDNIYHHIMLTYHRQETGGTCEIVYRRFSPFSHAMTMQGTLNSNGHTQWNQSLVQLSNGHFIFTYYDYASGDPGYTLYASRMDLYGMTVETTRLITPTFSSPALYNQDSTGFSRIGEYQGLATLNDVLYASTVYIPTTTPRVGNAWAVRFTTP